MGNKNHSSASQSTCSPPDWRGSVFVPLAFVALVALGIVMQGSLISLSTAWPASNLTQPTIAVQWELNQLRQENKELKELLRSKSSQGLVSSAESSDQQQAVFQQANPADPKLEAWKQPGVGLDPGTETRKAAASLESDVATTRGKTETKPDASQERQMRAKKDNVPRSFEVEDRVPASGNDRKQLSNLEAAKSAAEWFRHALPYPKAREWKYAGLTPEILDNLTDQQLAALRPPVERKGRIYFNHIPKTGGTSVGNSLSACVAGRKLGPHKIVCTSPKPECIESTTRCKEPTCAPAKQKLRKQIGGVGGVQTHRGHGWPEAIGDGRVWNTVAVVREPVSYAKSVYNWAATGRTGKSGLQERYKKKSLSGILQNMVELGPRYYRDASSLCKQAPGKEQYFFQSHQVWGACGPLRCNCSFPAVQGGSNVSLSAALMFAKYHLLRETQVVGVQDDYPSFALRMRASGLCPAFPGKVPRNNVLDNKVQGAALDADDERLVRTVLWAELDLYHFAKRIVAAEAKYPHLLPKAV